jgi:hypothetical protein
MEGEEDGYRYFENACDILVGWLLVLDSFGVTPSKWLTETACDIDVDHHDGALLVEYFLIRHRTNILPNVRFYLIVY